MSETLAGYYGGNLHGSAFGTSATYGMGEVHFSPSIPRASPPSTILGADPHARSHPARLRPALDADLPPWERPRRQPRSHPPAARSQPELALGHRRRGAAALPLRGGRRADQFLAGLPGGAPAPRPPAPADLRRGHVRDDRRARPVRQGHHRARAAPDADRGRRRDDQGIGAALARVLQLARQGAHGAHHRREQRRLHRRRLGPDQRRGSPPRRSRRRAPRGRRRPALADGRHPRARLRIARRRHRPGARRERGDLGRQPQRARSARRDPSPPPTARASTPPGSRTATSSTPAR